MVLFSSKTPTSMDGKKRSQELHAHGNSTLLRPLTPLIRPVMPMRSPQAHVGRIPSNAAQLAPRSSVTLHMDSGKLRQHCVMQATAKGSQTCMRCQRLQDADIGSHHLSALHRFHWRAGARNDVVPVGQFFKRILQQKHCVGFAIFGVGLLFLTTVSACARTWPYGRGVLANDQGRRRMRERERKESNGLREKQRRKGTETERETLRAACMVMNKFHRLAHEYRNAST